MTETEFYAPPQRVLLIDDDPTILLLGREALEQSGFHVFEAADGAEGFTTFKNKLPRRHVLPIDPTIMGAEGAPNRTCVHLHGGAVPWISDGGPFAWFRPNDDPTDTSPL